ncbi:ribonuclease E inhibitor RraB [Pseudomonas cremoricolorata]|uniref:ribonuclease E inhibitor RraB n=1 Tax=Pseudomonas cremoricolorata TaxID=157783 RepID=UPI0004148D4B|nr:ribonuclease E inhibitor RraB [Pseudomonas cremoricolorata]
MTSHNDDISSTVLRQMKEGGFDFTRFHPIEFYAVFPSEEDAWRAAQAFRGESTLAQVHESREGDWHLELSKVMYATQRGIGAFEQALERVVSPLGGEVNGWGVKQERIVA